MMMNNTITSKTVRIGVLVLLIGTIFMSASAATAAAQSNAAIPLQTNELLCASDSSTTVFGDIVDTFITAFAYSAIPIFAMLYQLDGVLEFFAIGAETKQKIKQHERNLWLGAGKVYLVPAFIGIFANSILGVSVPPSCFSNIFVF